MRLFPQSLAWAAASAAGSSVHADIINVPGDQPTIQAGIDVAVNGDEVVVADGTYSGPGNVNLDFGGRSITVRSASGDPASCVIDGQNMPLTRGFQFQNGETSAAIVDGFTIANGNMNGGSFPDDAGGAVLIIGATPTIRNCCFVRNTAGNGGAVVAFQVPPGGDPPDPVLSDCEFRGNRGAEGGAILIGQSDLQILECVFVGNVATASGAAVNMQVQSNVWVVDCEFSGNTAGCGTGGAIQDFGSQLRYGGSLFCRNTPDDISSTGNPFDLGGNVFDDGCPSTTRNVPADHGSIQRAIDLAGNGDEVLVAPGTYTETLDFLGKTITLRGAGGPDVTVVDAQAAGTVVTFDACAGPTAIIEGLTITGGSATDGGGIVVDDASPTIDTCIIDSCAAANSGGGVHVTGGGPSITGCTISGNAAATGGGLFAAAGAAVTVADSAFCQNVPDHIGGLVTLNGLVFISENEDCDPLVTTGACCLGDTCMVGHELDCLAAGGVYQGDGVACTEAGCPLPCDGDLNGDGQVSTADLLALLAGWGICP